MRMFCLVFLVIVALAIAGFAMQNRQEVSLTFFDRDLSFPVAGVLGVVYVLGMLTGWSFVGLLRRSWDRALDFDDRRAAAR